MRYERVYGFWVFYDGIRTGIADLNGAPHYFSSLFDETEDEYSDNFRLYPVGGEFLRRAMRNWDIYKAWWKKFHRVDLRTRLGADPGIDPEYDEDRFWLDKQIPNLQPISILYRAKFRDLPGQERLSPGMILDCEVEWSPAPV